MALPLLWALPCALLALWLAVQHPLSGIVAVTAVLVAGALAAWRPVPALAAILAMIPLLSWAPWTGWMLVEELDIAVLTVLAGSWLGVARLRRAGTFVRDASWPVADGAARVGWLLALVYAACLALSLQRGLADAGDWPLRWEHWGFWQGWREPMNSVRGAKAWALALFVWPLWQALQAVRPQAAGRAVLSGGLLALAGVSVLATWERWAWPGLTNFSTDYRTTALFWETHVGGAALDAFLALMLPFVFQGLRGSLSPWRWGLILGVLALAAYAALTTFSRGLYLAAVVSLLLWAWLTWRQRDPAAGPAPPRGLVAAGLWWASFSAGAWWVFAAGGYRAMGAWWGLFALLLAGTALDQPHAGRFGPRRKLVTTLTLALASGLAAAVAAVALPGAWKAPYLLYGLLLALGLGLAPTTAWRSSEGPSAGPHHAGWLALWVALLPAAAAVAWHWAPPEAPQSWAVPPVVALAALAAWRLSGHRGVGPPGGRWRGLSLVAMTVSALIVGTLAGGAYLETRVAGVKDDWAGRLQHWSRAAGLPRTLGEALLGIGVGRFPARFALQAEPEEATGDYGWLADAQGGGYLALTAGRHMLGFGELLRVSQRIGALPAGPATVRWRARVDAPAALHLEVCRKHLLYDNGCRVATIQLHDPATAGRWAEGRLVLVGPAMTFASVFSLAVDTRGGRVEIDDLSLVDADGREHVRNGAFERGLSFWLPSSDRHHLPWHAKNLGLHLVVEQGWIGALSFAALLMLALTRMLFGRASRHPLAPTLAAGITGLLLVGLFDSVLDIPRVALALYLLLGVAITLRAPPLAASGGPGWQQGTIRGIP